MMILFDSPGRDKQGGGGAGVRAWLSRLRCCLVGCCDTRDALEMVWGGRGGGELLTEKVVDPILLLYMNNLGTHS